MITLREITESNLEQVLSLDVFEHQNNYVSTTAYSLAQAWLYHDTAFPFAIYSDELLIGFVMLGYYKVKKQYTLWKFLIDKRYQNKGYGKQALKLALKYLVDKFNVNEIYTGVAFEKKQNICNKKDLRKLRSFCQSFLFFFLLDTLLSGLLCIAFCI